MIKFNVLVDNLGARQLNLQVIETVNQIVEGGEISPIIFFEEIHTHAQMPRCPTMQMLEAWGQDGVSMATSLDTAVKLLEQPGPTSKLVYIYAVEWMYGPQRIYGSLYDLFNHPEIKIVARTEDYKQGIEKTFNATVDYVLPEFEYEPLVEIIKNESKG